MKGFAYPQATGVGELPSSVVISKGNYTAGDLLGARVSAPPAAHLTDFRDGTAAAPVKIGVSASYSRVDATSRAELNAMGPEGTDGPDGATALRATIKGAPTSQVQIAAVVATAWQTGAYEGAGADACPILGVGRTSGGATGRAIAAYLESNRENEASGGQQGLEIRVKNSSGVSDSYVAGAPSKSMGIWINASSVGEANSACAVQIGKGFSRRFDVGAGFNEGSVATATIRDDTESTISLDIRKPHSVAAIKVAAEAGAIIVGASALSGESPPQLLEIASGSTSRSPALKLSATSNASQQLQFNNPAGNFNIGQAGATNAYITGTAAGDGVITTGAKIVHIGQGAGAAVLKIGAGLGFYGAAPVARSAAYTQTYSTAARVQAEPELPTTITATLITELDAELNKTNKAVNELKKLINSVIDDFQANGMFQ